MNTYHKPFIAINFKKVKGKTALEIAKTLDQIEDDFKERCYIVLMTQLEDADIISKNISLPVFIQDIYSETKFHQISSYKFLLNRNIVGVLLNHPEEKLCESYLQKSIKIARENSLKVIIGSSSIEEAIVMNEKYKPDYIAYEDCNLIGTKISIVESNCAVINEAIRKIKTNVIFGGGINTNKDIYKIIHLGGKGALVSSIIMKSEDPFKILKKLLDPPVYSEII